MPATIHEKVAFLKEPGAYGPGVRKVETIETHMSWVFLAGDQVYKLKKPVKFPFLDFTRLAARERNCLEEVRLNRRLAPGIYLGVMPLMQSPDGMLSLGGTGEVIDWLVQMRRLPADRMLDVLLSANRLSTWHLDRLATVLARFYRAAERPAIKPQGVIDNLLGQQAMNREILAGSAFGIDQKVADAVLEAVERRMQKARDEIVARVEQGRYVEGHGDLRPEHVCFSRPIAVFDCLEFSRDLRLIDPFDELAFLGMECASLGAPWVSERLIGRMRQKLEDDISEPLVRFYAAFRATMRARLSLGHLHFGSSADQEKWVTKTDRYIRFAHSYLRLDRPGA